MKDKIVNFHNKLSDKTFIWFPFVFLRPQPEEEITQYRLIKMTACFGLYGILFYFLKRWFGGSFEISSFWKPALFFPVGFFIWFQIVTRPLWNIRARELRRSPSNDKS